MSDGGGSGIERHTLAVLVVNEPGVLARVIGLFSGRGYNIESLTVAEIAREQGRDEGLSRITLVTSGTRMIIDQIKAQLARLVPIRAVRDLTEEGPFIARELALVKVVPEAGRREQADAVALRFGARPVASGDASPVYEISDASERVAAFLAAMAALGRLDVARTGTVALGAGAEATEC